MEYLVCTYLITKIYLFAVIEEKREPIFQEALKDLGPPDGSILLQFEEAIGKLRGRHISCIFCNLWNSFVKLKFTNSFVCNYCIN